MTDRRFRARSRRDVAELDEIAFRRDGDIGEMGRRFHLAEVYTELAAVRSIGRRDLHAARQD